MNSDAAACCPECRGESVWVDQVSSRICTQCGTLLDPTQSVLSSHLEQNENYIRHSQFDPLWPQASLPRSRNGWRLPGQGKDVRDAAHMRASHEFIRSLASSLSASSVAPRAIILFTQAMSRGAYRWGRRARLTGAASLMLALRESRKPCSVRDIAFLMGESGPQPVSHAFVTVQSLLDLTRLAPPDPSIYIPILHSYLWENLNTPHIRKDTAAIITSLQATTVLHNSLSLSNILLRLGPSCQLNNLPAPPTACALLLLGIEAEQRAPLQHVGELTTFLGSRVDTSKRIVMSRYGAVSELVAEWVKEVPWLDQGTNLKRHPRPSKRSVFVKDLKDVIQFQDAIWKKKLEAFKKAADAVTQDDDTDDPSDGEQDGDPKRTEHGSAPPRKKPKWIRSPLNEASLYLLDPLSQALSSGSQCVSDDAIRGQGQGPSTPVPLTTYLLAAPPSTLSLRAPPTRLQLLCAARGGNGDDAQVQDCELFGEGELEGMLRSADEINRMKADGLFEWTNDDEEGAAGGDRGGNSASAPLQPGGVSARGGKSKKLVGGGSSGGTRRVNMEAFARIFSGDADLSDDGDDREPGASPDRPDRELDVVGDWRPLLPDLDGADIEWDRYEQEC